MESLQENVARLWDEIAMRRFVKHDDRTGAERAWKTAVNLRHTQRLRESGWDDYGVGHKLGQPQGRGWHDAGQPAKIPL